MSRGVFFYTEGFQRYDMGEHHPLKPVCLRRTHALLQSYGALEAVSVETPRVQASIRCESARTSSST